MTAPVLFIDTETLGLDADHQPIWEVGMANLAGDTHSIQIQVTPRQIDLAHPIALEMTRFNDRYDKRQASSRYNAAVDLSAVIAKGTHLVGACISFDEERLRRLLWEHGQPIPWHYHTIDVEVLAVGYLSAHSVDGTPDLPYNSGAISRLVGVDPERFDRHTAVGDALWAREIYLAVTR